jgi:amino acid transporter
MNETKAKLTDTQLRVLQVTIGIISAVALLASLFLPNFLGNTNTLISYLWLVIFVIVMFGRRWIERRYNMRLALYNLAMLDTLAIIIVIYGSLLFFAPQVFPEGSATVEWSIAIKLLLVIGIGLIILIFGIILPASRYFKRKEEGTLRPIRLPEPEEINEEEAPEQNEEDDAHAGLSPLEIQIMEMTKDLDNKDSDGESSDSEKK